MMQIRRGQGGVHTAIPLHLSAVPTMALRREYQTLLLALATIVLLVVGTGCRGENANRAHVEDLRYRLLPGNARIVTGEFVNDSDETIPVAQIEVSLFDADNRRISSMQIVVKDVAAGASVEFREPVDSKLDIQGARVRRILIP